MRSSPFHLCPAMQQTTRSTTDSIDDSSREQVSALLAELRHREKIASNLQLWLKAVSEFNKMRFSEEPIRKQEFIYAASELARFGHKFLKFPDISEVCALSGTSVEVIKTNLYTLELERDAADFENDPELAAEFAKLEVYFKNDTGA